MVKVVSFDLDGTLVDYSFIDAIWFEGIPRLYAEKWKAPIKEALKIVTREYDKVGEDRLEWYDIKYWFNRFGLDGDWRKLLKEYSGRIRAYPDAHETLKDLSGKYKLVLNSNSPREFLELEIGHTGLRKYFYKIFSSTSDFRQVKKTGEYYIRICGLLGISPREMIHVGDNFKFDFHIPKEVGVYAIYLDRKGDWLKNKTEDRVRVISSLSELKTILRGLEYDC